MKEVHRSVLSIALGVCLIIGCRKQIENSATPITVSAGSDQVITLPKDSVSLSGTASATTVTKWQWLRLSGPASCLTVSPGQPSTTVKNLTAGVYEFELSATDSYGVVARDTVQVTVLRATVSLSPKAYAGPDQTIVLPNNSVILDAGTTTSPGNVITYIWTKIAGPSTYNIATPTGATTLVTDLVEGIYQFELQVTIAAGVPAKDTVQISVITNAGLSPYWSSLKPFNSAEFFFAPRYWFGGANFLMAAGDRLYAVSNKGNMFEVNGSTAIAFPENMPTEPITFTVNGKGYCIGNGHCWEFDPGAKRWVRKRDPPAHVVGPLVIGDRVYLKTADNFLAYDPIADSYTAKKTPPGLHSNLLGYFVLHAEGYYVDGNGQCLKYDPTTDTWQRKTEFYEAKNLGSTFSFFLNDYGYIAGDLNNRAYNNNEKMKIWQYDPTADKWKQDEEEYPGTGVYSISSISMKGVVYVGLGYNNGDFNATDWWSFKY